jgi:nitroimidazol reductase NimA-like FMN-containing flavoprotein (pyridoxamine 5'-phosphate oxidase superfamily)
MTETVRPAPVAAAAFGAGERARSERSRVRRMPKRGAYDRASVHAILDEGLICHAGFIHAGAPVVIPTSYGRDGDLLYLHGSVASRMLRTLAEGVEMAVTVTLLDGLVLARSAFNHSMNYRSVVVFGRARLVDDPVAKLAALYCLSEHLVPGRWDAVRAPTERELKATSVLALPLDEASAKIRCGPPEDDDEDYALPCWAGVLPFTLQVGPAVDDPRLTAGIAVPGHVRDYGRPGGSPEPAAGT